MTLLQCKKILKELRQENNPKNKGLIKFYERCEIELVKEINEKLKEEFKNLEFVEVVEGIEHSFEGIKIN